MPTMMRIRAPVRDLNNIGMHLPKGGLTSNGVRVERKVRPQYSGQFQYIDNLAVLKQQPSVAEANMVRTQILMTATVRIEKNLRAPTPT